MKHKRFKAVGGAAAAVALIGTLGLGSCQNTPPARFVPSSSGVWDEKTGEAVLTTGGKDQRNAIASTSSWATDNLTITASILADGPADGIALALLDPTEQPFGGLGSGIGVSWLNVSSVYLDTYRNDGDPPVPYVGMTAYGRSGTLTPTAHSEQLAALGSGWHQFRFHLEGDTVTVHLDGVQVLSAPRPENLPDVVRVAFSASTGGYVGEHRVKDITIQ